MISAHLTAALLDALAVLLPVDCAGCGRADRALCSACRALLVPQLSSQVLSDGTRVSSALRYEGPVRQAIIAMKEQGRTDAAGALAAPFARAVHAALDGPVELAALPGAAAFGRRGYDPVRLLLSRAGLGRPADVLLPTRSRAAQKSLDREQREKNLANWLTAGRDLTGRRFLVVDDVVTTGASILEAARALRAGGAEVVGAATLASTPRFFPLTAPACGKPVTSPASRSTVGKRGAIQPPGFTG